MQGINPVMCPEESRVQNRNNTDRLTGNGPSNHMLADTLNHRDGVIYTQTAC